jgi:hypothetical protein
VAPPVITAVFPFSLVISCNLRVLAVPRVWCGVVAFETAELGRPKRGAQCAGAHIGGAGTIRSGRPAMAASGVDVRLAVFERRCSRCRIAP